MGKSKAKERSRAVCVNGSTVLECGPLYAEYKNPFWFLHIQPALLPPGRRKSSQRNIYVNGKKMGYAYYCDGCIPMPPYLSEGTGLATKLLNVIRVKLGWFCRKSIRGFFCIKLHKTKYFALRRVTKEKIVYGNVYYNMSNDLVGSFICNEDFSQIHVRLSEEGLPNTMKVIAGYMVDVSIYNTVVDELNRSVELTIERI